MRECNLGYSDTVQAAIMNALRRHGEVTSVTEDADTTLRLGEWRLITYPRTNHPRWEPIQYLERDGAADFICGQCASCSDVTHDTVRRTTRNLPYIESESAHFLEDRIMRDVLRQVANGVPCQDVAHAAFEMATQKRTRWYA